MYKDTKEGLLAFLKQLPLYFVTLSIVAVVGLVSYITLANVDVLKDWTVSVDSSRTYKPGDTLKITSTATKLRNAQPDSVRYVQCLKSGVHEKTQTGYKIQETDWEGFVFLNKNSNNASQGLGTFSTSFDATLPLSISKLPNTCRIYVYINYKVFNFRTHPEYTYSNNFTVEPLPAARISIGEGMPLITIYGRPEQLNQPNQIVRLQPGPSLQGTEIPTSAQPQPTPSQSTPQPQEAPNTPTTPQQNPGLIESAVNVVGGALDGITKAVGLN